MSPKDKKSLREQMLKARQALVPADKQRLDRKINQRAIEFLEALDISSLHVFRPIVSQAEINSDEIFTWALERNIEVYSTIKIEGLWQLVRFESARKFVRAEPKTIEVIILPLLAFDHRLQRLGYGGGYYDRLLNLYPISKRVGLSYEGQRVKLLPNELHDLPLDAVITELKTYSKEG